MSQKLVKLSLEYSIPIPLTQYQRDLKYIVGRQTGSFLILNHAAYNAGKNSNVSAVATINPPMIATAIGPKNTLRDSGIIASTAASAVNTIGRKRRTVASIIACHGLSPAAMSCSIWSTRITELRMIIPDNAMVPSMATKPNG